MHDDHAPTFELLELSLLGPWHARLNGVALAPLPTRHARAVLARLALAHPAPLSRAALRADVFAAFAPESAARSLRTTIYYLRRALGERIWSEGEQIGLDPRLEVRTDVAEFEALTEPSAPAAALAAGVARYAGPLLGGMGEGWARHEGQRLHIRYVGALRRLTALAQAGGDATLAADAAGRWAAAEPWDEEAHLALLTALLAAGSRNAALAQLQRARAILRGEWNQSPGAAFEALARRIMRMPADAAPPDPPPSTAPGPLPAIDLSDFDMLPLIGREVELTLLADAWNRARSGEPGLWRVEGVAGAGKTRLARELVARARLQGDALVLWALADGYSAGRPFALLRDLIRRASDSLARRLNDACAVLDPPSLAALLDAIPELADDAGRPSTPATPPDPAQAPARRRNASLALLAALAGANPLLLIVDNAHLADAESLDVFGALADAHQRSLVVLLQRPRTQRASDPAAAVTITLRELAGDSAAELLRGALGGRLAPELERAIVERSAGNPLFVRELLRALDAQRLLSYDPAHGWQLAYPRMALPEMVADLLLERLRALSDGGRELARLLAVLGQPADEPLLDRLLPDLAARFAAQAELLEHGVLVERDGFLRFDHDWLRETLLAAMRATERAPLHARIAAALGAGEPELRMWHHAGAGNWEAALDDALAVAGRALDHAHLAALRPALDLAQQAVDATQLDPADPRRWALLALRERAGALAERGESWRADLDALLALAEASGRPDWLADALNRHGAALRERAEHGRAEAALRRAAAVAAEAGLQQFEIEARQQLASVLDDGGAVAAALAESRRAAALGALVGDPALHARARLVLAYMEMRNGHLAEADALATALLADERVQRQPMLAGRAARQLGIIKIARHEYEPAFELLREAVRRAQAAGDLQGMLISQTSLFYELVNFGLFDEARPLGETTIELARRLRANMQLGALLGSMALVQLAAGAPAEALPLAQESAAIALDHGLPEYAAASLKLAADVALALDDPAAAHAAVSRAHDLLAGIADPPLTLDATAARAWLALGRVEQAREAARAAAAHRYPPGLNANRVTEDLWWAAEVLAHIEGEHAARPVRRRAYAHFLDRLATLTSPAMRRAYLEMTEAHRALAALPECGPRRLVLLPHREAPTGRPLYRDEWVPVIWTVEAPGDPRGPVPKRHARLRRLAEEALAQGALATVEALAAVLGVAPRTVKLDLQHLRQQGVAVVTRGGAGRRSGSS